MEPTVPLSELHRLVPAAEEEDVLDELAEEQARAVQEEVFGRDLHWPLGAARDDQATHEPTETEDEEPPLTPGQVLGLVEHQLGGQVIAEEPLT